MSVENQQDFIPFDFGSESDTSEKIDVPSSPERVNSIDVLTPLPIPPWVPDHPNYSSDLLELLNQEIDDYLDFVTPTDKEHTLRLIALKRLEEVLLSTFPNCQMRTFGSFETRLYLPSSDLDVVVLDETMESPSCLYTLEDALEKAGIMSRIEVIASARVYFINRDTHYQSGGCIDQFSH